jgi:hypothetical protein
LIAEANAIENVSEVDIVKFSKEGSHLQVFAGTYRFFRLRYSEHVYPGAVTMALEQGQTFSIGLLLQNIVIEKLLYVN